MPNLRPLLGGLTIAFFGAVLLLATTHVPAHSYSSGAPPGFSGPEQLCNACHGGVSANPPDTGTGSVTITAPTTFLPGEEIAITVNLNNTTATGGADPRSGFQMSARDANLNHIGEFIADGTTVQLSQGDSRYPTHVTANETEWSFSWLAPTEDPPTQVTFYVAGNAANANGAPDADDLIYTATQTLDLMTVANEPDALPLALELEAVYPNPSRGDAQAAFTLAESGAITAVLRDGRGRTVRVLEQGARPAGTHTLRVDADGLAAGLYFLTVTSSEGAQTRPFTLTR